MRKIEVISGNALNDELVERWDEIQNAAPELDNPFLRPEFTQAVAAVRDDVEVAVLEEDGQIRGFFPFQRGRHDAGTPVGGHISNCQALIVAEEVEWDALKIIADCRLSSWYFDNLIASQASFQQSHHFTEPSGFLDLSAGYEAYVVERRSASKSFKHVLRKERKLQREVGDCRFDLHTDRLDVLQTLLSWKTRQCEEDGTFNAFGFGWSIALLKQILRTQSDRFRPFLSVFYIGEEPAVIDYDLASDSAVDGWLTAFNPDFYKYSPGQIATLRKAELLAQHGIRRFYLGRGGGFHKERLVSGSVLLAEGSVDRHHVRGAVKRGWTATREWLRNSPFRAPARTVKRWLTPLESHRLNAVQPKTTSNQTPSSEND